VADGLAWLESRALFVAAVAAVLVESFAGIPTHLAQDGWLALVAGRIIAQHGIPTHDYLTVMAYGVRWTDQQWLAQLSIYGLQRLGGLALFCVFYVFLTGLSFGLGIAASRHLGAQDRYLIWMLPVGGFFYIATAVSIRTQGFAYPFFVTTLWLLAAEVRRPTRRRVYLVFPLLIVWANLHGSVTLGVAMSVVYGATLLWQSCRDRGWLGLLHRRGLIFVIGSPLCLFATPYGLSIIRYYRVTLFNSEFSKLVSEWQPVTAYMILAVPLLILIFGMIWTLGRSGRRTPAFDQIVLAILAFAAIDAVRNITWFGLAIVVLLPPAISGLRSNATPATRHRSVNLAIALTCIALVVVFTISTFIRPASWFESTYPKRAVSVAAGFLERDPHVKIFADVRYADWLVWHDPKLAGHIAYDTSLENLTSQQLLSLATLTQVPEPGTRGFLAPYSVLMLNPSNHSTNRILVSRPGVKVILRSKRVLIATKPAS